MQVKVSPSDQGSFLSSLRRFETRLLKLSLHKTVKILPWPVCLAHFRQRRILHGLISPVILARCENSRRQPQTPDDPAQCHPDDTGILPPIYRQNTEQTRGWRRSQNEARIPAEIDRSRFNPDIHGKHPDQPLAPFPSSCSPRHWRYLGASFLRCHATALRTIRQRLHAHPHGLSVHAQWRSPGSLDTQGQGFVF